MRSQSELPVLVAGAGPVGVVTALALARQGLAVHVFEAEACVSVAPRAATIHASTLEMLAELDLLDEVINRGLVAPRFRVWERSSARMIAEFDFGILRSDTRYPFVVQCEQHKLANIAIERLRAYPQARLEFGARVLSVQQRDDHVEVTVAGGEGTRTVCGSYLIGADGGRSTVRKSLDIDFEGYTHPERFLVLTTTFDFGAVFGQCFRNYFTDPEEWCALFKVAGDDGLGLWRVLFPTRAQESDEEAMAGDAIERRLQGLHVKTGRYPIVHRNIYRVHQRVAARFRSGRVFLVGDAAHVNNPLGGLGMNSGIHDTISLSRLLAGVILRRAHDATLDLYDKERRPLNIEYVQRETIRNKKRLEEKDANSRAEEFETLRRTSAEPTAHRAYLLRASLLESVQQSQTKISVRFQRHTIPT
jgi:3-(3-hydroxy-phenyl)propionate hydroxylase